jgi:hypothetical protein
VHECSINSGRLRYQTISTVAAITEDHNQDGFSSNKFYQMPVQQSSLNGPSLSHYRAGLCQILECRKQLANKTLMRLGIARDGAGSACAVVMPLVPLDDSNNTLLDYSKVAPYLANVSTLGSEVDVEVLSEECMLASGMRVAHPVGIVYRTKAIMEGKGGGKIFEGEVDSVVFDGRCMKQVELPLLKMTVAQLQQELGAWGLRRSGRKPELQLRLRDAIVGADLKRQNSSAFTTSTPHVQDSGQRVIPTPTYVAAPTHTQLGGGGHGFAVVERQAAKRSRVDYVAGASASTILPQYMNPSACPPPNMASNSVRSMPNVVPTWNVAPMLQPYLMGHGALWHGTSQPSLPHIFWPHLPRFYGD